MACFLEGLLDAQHLLDLVAQRELVLEDQRHVLAQVHRCAFVREHTDAQQSSRALAIGFPSGIRLSRADRGHRSVQSVGR